RPAMQIVENPIASDFPAARAGPGIALPDEVLAPHYLLGFEATALHTFEFDAEPVIAAARDVEPDVGIPLLEALGFHPDPAQHGALTLAPGVRDRIEPAEFWVRDVLCGRPLEELALLLSLERDRQGRGDEAGHSTLPFRAVTLIGLRQPRHIVPLSGFTV